MYGDEYVLTHRLSGHARLVGWSVQRQEDIIALTLVRKQAQLARDGGTCLDRQGLLQYAPQLEPAGSCDCDSCSVKSAMSTLVDKNV